MYSWYAWKYNAVDFSGEAHVGNSIHFPKCCAHLETSHKSLYTSRIIYYTAVTYYYVNKLLSIVVYVSVININYKWFE